MKTILWIPPASVEVFESDILGSRPPSAEDHGVCPTHGSQPCPRGEKCWQQWVLHTSGWGKHPSALVLAWEKVVSPQGCQVAERLLLDKEGRPLGLCTSFSPARTHDPHGWLLYSPDRFVSPGAAVYYGAAGDGQIRVPELRMETHYSNLKPDIVSAWARGVLLKERIGGALVVLWPEDTPRMELA